MESEFNASHQLTMPDGQKEALHAHQWQLKVAVNSQKLDQMGVVIDFHELKAAINTVTGPLEGKKLEDLACFQGTNVSAEAVAKYIYDRLKEIIKSDVALDSVELMEDVGCWAKYRP